MKQPSKDHPNVIVFPPLIILGTLILAVALQWLMPLGWIAHIDQIWRTGVGVAAIILGALITASGRFALMRRGTNVNPLHPSTALATGGIYRWTRNPMYSGVAPILVGIALIFAIDWLVLLIIPSYCVLHFGVVKREEVYLEDKFGDAYRRYRAHVPRYAWPF